MASHFHLKLLSLLQGGKFLHPDVVVEEQKYQAKVMKQQGHN